MGMAPQGRAPTPPALPQLPPLRPRQLQQTRLSGQRRTARCKEPRLPPTDRKRVQRHRDIVAKRMEATRRWINSDLRQAYSIQLLVASSDQQLRNHLNALPKFIEVNDIYMYRSVALGRPTVNVLWGSFRGRDAALDELDQLPRSLRANRPYVRTIEGIRAEVDRLGPSAAR